VSDTARGHLPFAIWNRTGNRLVRGLVGSPLHPLVSRRLTLVTVTGRRSGKQYTLPVEYKLDGDRVTIPVLWPERKTWWRNLLEGAPVKLLLRGKERSGAARAEVAADGKVAVHVTLDAL
jgi:F420H(2)-dependent quinone reductase